MALLRSYRIVDGHVDLSGDGLQGPGRSQLARPWSGRQHALAWLPSWSISGCRAGTPGVIPCRTDGDTADCCRFEVERGRFAHACKPHLGWRLRRPGCDDRPRRLQRPCSPPTLYGHVLLSGLEVDLSRHRDKSTPSICPGRMINPFPSRRVSTRELRSPFHWWTLFLACAVCRSMRANTKNPPTKAANTATLRQTTLNSALR